MADYVFGRSYNILEDAPSSCRLLSIPFITSRKAVLYIVVFPWSPKLISQLPESWLPCVISQVLPSLQFKKVNTLFGTSACITLTSYKAISEQTVEILQRRAKGDVEL